MHLNPDKPSKHPALGHSAAYLPNLVWIAVAFLAAVPLAIKLFAYPSYIGSDDAYIHLQVARNIYTNHVWGIDPAVRCNLSTSPLFTLLLVASHLIFQSHDIFAMQVASCLATVVGLLAIFLRVLKTTSRLTAAFLGMASASFAANLWRWNGTLMEATYAFAAVALILLCFSSYRFTPRKAAATGTLLGLSTLLRPELFSFALLAILLTLLLAPRGHKLVPAIAMLAGCLIPVGSWLLFSRLYFSSFLPTTFYAKTSPSLILWNPLILTAYAQLIALSLLWPVLFFATCLFALRGRPLRSFPIHLALPLGGILLLAAFYYLRALGLESPGRYLLPAFPMFCVAAAEIFAIAVSQKPSLPWAKFVLATLALHCITCVYINSRFIAPVLSSFQNEYAAAMHRAADYLASHTGPGDPILVELDVGALCYWGNGRFTILDGGGLASPELAQKSVTEQIALVKPKFLVQSQGLQPFEWQSQYPNLHPLWNLGYRGLGLSSPKALYINIYAVATNP
jgi:hypothetical protein